MITNFTIINQISILESLKTMFLNTIVSVLEVLKMHILGEFGDHSFHDIHFGFIENHGTNMAVSLTHYAINYPFKRGPFVFSWSLDDDAI